MRLTEFLDCLLILDETAASTREQAIDAILDAMAVKGLFPRSLLPDVRDSIIRREELGPTGIGEGVAIPHTWHAGVDRTVGAVAVAQHGLDFSSLDGQPVRIIALLVTPLGREGERSKTAAFDTLLRHLRHSTFRHVLLGSRTPDELREAILLADQADA